MRIYLDFFHAVGHRVPVDALNARSQAFFLEFRAHVGTFLLLAAGQHTPPKDICVGRRVGGEKKRDRVALRKRKIDVPSVLQSIAFMVL